MKAKPIKIVKGQGYIQCSIKEATHIKLNLPCPLNQRIIPVIINGSRDKHNGTVWSWNGDIENPTLKPSVLTNGGRWDEDMTKYTEYKCHTWITDGKAQFLGDCTHKLVNQTLPLLEIEAD